MTTHVDSAAAKRSRTLRSPGLRCSALWFLMKKSEDNLIDRTLEVWQPRNAHRLSDEDARAILENVKGFFTLLLEWETNEQQKKGGGQDESHYAKSA